MSALLLAGLIASANPKLEAGVELYRSGDLVGSLAIFLEALDAGTQPERAKARLYVGLIQHRTGNESDALGSFRIALELSSAIRPPKGTPRKTMAAFEEVRAEREAASPPKEKKQTRRRTEGEREVGPDRKGPELLTPVEGGPGRGEDWAARQGPVEDETVETSLENKEPNELPIVGWVTAGVGAAALITGVTLGVLAKVNNDRALDDPDKAHAAEVHNSAGIQHKASIASFGAAGVLFGIAAITVTF